MSSDQVTRVSRTAAASEPATTPPISDVDMDDHESGPAPESEPVPAPTRKPQRKPKKQVPVGSNGLKKKRVVKSRMKTDDKGYFGARRFPCNDSELSDLSFHIHTCVCSDRRLFVVRICGRRGTTPREACKREGEGEGEEGYCSGCIQERW